MCFLWDFVRFAPENSFALIDIQPSVLRRLHKMFYEKNKARLSIRNRLTVKLNY